MLFSNFLFQAELAEEKRREKIRNRTRLQKCRIYSIRAAVNIVTMGILAASIYAIIKAVEVSTDPVGRFNVLHTHTNMQIESTSHRLMIRLSATGCFIQHVEPLLNLCWMARTSNIMFATFVCLHLTNKEHSQCLARLTTVDNVFCV